MPTPMPTMRCGGGRPVGDVHDVPHHVAERHRDPEPEQRGEQGQPHRHRRAEGDEQDDGRGDAGRCLRSPRPRSGTAPPPAPPTSTCRVSSPAARIGSTSVLGLRGGELVVVLVERRRRRTPSCRPRRSGRRRRRERAGDADDVLVRGDVGEDLLGPGLHLGRRRRRRRRGSRSGRCRRSARGNCSFSVSEAASDSEPGCR